MFNLFKRKNEPLTETYKRFYEENKSLNLAFYGLIPLGYKSPSNFYTESYSKTIDTDFSFQEECVWEDFDSENDADKAIDRVQFGNITIAKEGCGTYWILITTGSKKGEVWLLTEFGITPITKSLKEWKEKIVENHNFWYENLKDWGPFEYSVFYSHAPKKMVTANAYVFGVSSDLCRDCNEFMKKASKMNQKEIVITSPKGTTIYANGNNETV